MPFRIVAHLPEGLRRYLLQVGTCTLGSDPDNTVQIPHMSISRHHAELRVGDDEIWICDLDSTNGTKLDHSRLAEPTRWEPGTSLRIGTIRAELESVSQADLSAASPLNSEPTIPPGALSPPTDNILTERPPIATLSGQALEDLVLGQWSDIASRILDEASPLDVAQAIGAGLFRSLPCLYVEISHQPTETQWFVAGKSSEGTDAVGTALRSRDEVTLKIDIVPAVLAQELEPVVSLAHTLVALAWKGKQSTRPTRQVRDVEQPAAAPRPPSLDPAMAEIMSQAEIVAGSRIGILIQGESGTGKEVMARFLHRASLCRGGPFEALNCAALPRDLLEAELFGIEEGVATGVVQRAGKFESAHGGTLFLDEIGDMALETQAKILRVLQEGQVYRLGGKAPRPAQPRILAATNRNVEAMIEKGTFRRDLYYRLAGWVVTLPALRDRLLDIPNLAILFLKEISDERGRSSQGISVAAMEALIEWRWPGNIRELRHEIERASLFLAEGQLLEKNHLNPEIQGNAANFGGLKERLEAFERLQIHRALEEADGDVGRAAEILAMGRSTLYRRMNVLGLDE